MQEFCKNPKGMIHLMNANLGSICYAKVRFLKIPSLFVS